MDIDCGNELLADVAISATQAPRKPCMEEVTNRAAREALGGRAHRACAPFREGKAGGLAKTITERPATRAGVAPGQRARAYRQSPPHATEIAKECSVRQALQSPPSGKRTRGLRASQRRSEARAS